VYFVVVKMSYIKNKHYIVNLLSCGNHAYLYTTEFINRNERIELTFKKSDYNAYNILKLNSILVCKVDVNHRSVCDIS